MTLHKVLGALAFYMSALTPATGVSETLEDFGTGSDTRWEYIADSVMGGVSDGQAVIGVIDGEPGVRLTGSVSTKNNGGFIQVRRKLPNGLPEGTQGVSMDVRGNGQNYYVFIRTAEMTRPWYYYNAAFTAAPGWAQTEIPLKTFQRSHAHLADQINPEDIISIALVAYGRDHDADLSVREITLY